MTPIRPLTGPEQTVRDLSRSELELLALSLARRISRGSGMEDVVIASALAYEEIAEHSHSSDLLIRLERQIAAGSGIGISIAPHEMEPLARELRHG